jgi:rhodanese-related sulfurtransferase
MRVDPQEDSAMRTASQMVAAAVARVEQIEPAAAAEEYRNGGAVMLDIREPIEWERHISGAVQVPRGLLEFAADPSSPRHNAELEPTGRVIVYCRSGVRASLAAATLVELGYENVANLTGGISAWIEAGLPTVEHHADL